MRTRTTRPPGRECDVTEEWGNFPSPYETWTENDRQAMELSARLPAGQTTEHGISFPIEQWDYVTGVIDTLVREDKRREARARRRLRKLGLFVRKDRVRIWDMDHHGGYMLVNDNNVVVGGERFSLTLDDLETWGEAE